MYRLFEDIPYHFIQRKAQGLLELHILYRRVGYLKRYDPTEDYPKGYYELVDYNTQYVFDGRKLATDFNTYYQDIKGQLEFLQSRASEFAKTVGLYKVVHKDCSEEMLTLSHLNN